MTDPETIKKLREAHDLISEWGIDPDDFISRNFRMRMAGGEADDNSIELHAYFMENLRIVVDKGLDAILIQMEIPNLCTCNSPTLASMDYCTGCGRDMRERAGKAEDFPEPDDCTCKSPVWCDYLTDQGKCRR
ncbi:MAG TPA: hypothetical protein ENI27_01450 [bacterium]|nr:hypothetical protein [bacterium]